MAAGTVARLAGAIGEWWEWSTMIITVTGVVAAMVPCRVILLVGTKFQWR